MFPVPFPELVELAVLLNEDLDHRHAGDVLLKEGVDLDHAGPDPSIGAANLDLEDHGGQENEGQDRQADQGQLPIRPEHDRYDAAQQEDVPEDAHDAGREELVEDVHVVGHAGDQPAHGIPVEVADVQGLDVTEDLDPQIVHDPLSGPVHQPRLCERAAELQNQEPEVKQCQKRETVPVADSDVLVDGDQRQERTRQLQGRHHQKQRYRCAHDPAVGSQVSQHPPGQSPVVDSTQDLFLVVLDHAIPNSCSSNCFRCISA